MKRYMIEAITTQSTHKSAVVDAENFSAAETQFLDKNKDDAIIKITLVAHLIKGCWFYFNNKDYEQNK